MTTRGEWAKQFLAALGNTNPSDSTVNFVASWTLAENTRATYNPLATTQPMAGSGCFSKHRDGSCYVRNYTDNGMGIEATVKTITNGFYPNILYGLRNNEPEKSANSKELGIWGTGLHGVALWRLGDHRGGVLLSHPGNQTSTPQPQQPPESTPAPNEQETDRNGLGGLRLMQATDSEQFATSVQYIIIGSLFIAIAIVLAIKTYVPTSQIIKTVAATAA